MGDARQIYRNRIKAVAPAIEKRQRLGLDLEAYNIVVFTEMPDQLAAAAIVIAPRVLAGHASRSRRLPE